MVCITLFKLDVKNIVVCVCELQSQHACIHHIKAIEIIQDRLRNNTKGRCEIEYLGNIQVEEENLLNFILWNVESNDCIYTSKPCDYYTCHVIKFVFTVIYHWRSLLLGWGMARILCETKSFQYAIRSEIHVSMRYTFHIGSIHTTSARIQTIILLIKGKLLAINSLLLSSKNVRVIVRFDSLLTSIGNRFEMASKCKRERSLAEVFPILAESYGNRIETFNRLVWNLFSCLNSWLLQFLSLSLSHTLCLMPYFMQSPFHSLLFIYQEKCLYFIHFHIDRHEEKKIRKMQIILYRFYCVQSESFHCELPEWNEVSSIFPFG